MGKKGKWFSSLKKALSPESKEKKAQRSKEKLLGQQQPLGPSGSESTSHETVKVPPPPPIAPPAQPEEVIITKEEDEQTKHAYSVAAAEAVATGPPAAVEVTRHANISRFAGKSKEEAAAIRIQTAFRGYLARRALRALRGLVRLKTLMEGPVVKRQAVHTLKCMQTLSRVQCQIRARRIRMSEENEALQRQLLQKHAKELVNLQMGEEWDDSLQSKEQIEASLLSKHEAAMRRERALAYAFTHQKAWKNSSKSTYPLFTDPRNPTWGWSWLERWMAGRSWEGRSVMEKELSNDHSSVKSAGRSTFGGEISKSYARYQLNSERQSPAASQKANQNSSLQSPATPSKASALSAGRKLKPPSPRGNFWSPDDDAKSVASVQSERPRRHSIAGSSVRDDESLASSPALPSYMVPTQSARAKTRLQSPMGSETNGTPEKGSAGPAKKRLSYPPSPARPRRHSGPPKLDSSINSINNSEVSLENGAGS